MFSSSSPLSTHEFACKINVQSSDNECNTSQTECTSIVSKNYVSLRPLKKRKVEQAHLLVSTQCNLRQTENIVLVSKNYVSLGPLKKRKVDQAHLAPLRCNNHEFRQTNKEHIECQIKNDLNENCQSLFSPDFHFVCGLEDRFKEQQNDDGCCDWNVKDETDYSTFYKADEMDPNEDNVRYLRSFHPYVEKNSITGGKKCLGTEGRIVGYCYYCISTKPNNTAP